MNISELEISKRTKKLLADNGIHTLEAIQKHMQQAPLTAIRGIGTNGAREIKNVLLQLGMEIPVEPQSERLPTPDDDQLADVVIAEIKDDYRFFWDKWHIYQNGIWSPVKNINHHVIKVLRENRRLGVRPSRARVNSVDFSYKQHWK